MSHLYEKSSYENQKWQTQWFADFVSLGYYSCRDATDRDYDYLVEIQVDNQIF